MLSSNVKLFYFLCRMELLSPQHWKDYELIDCGNFEKLERFGDYITIRPEPQALWPKVFSEAEWNKQAHVRFIPKSSSNGEWKTLKKMPEQWMIKYLVGSGSKQSSFKKHYLNDTRLVDKNDTNEGITRLVIRNVGGAQVVSWEFLH